MRHLTPSVADPPCTRAGRSTRLWRKRTSVNSSHSYGIALFRPFEASGKRVGGSQRCLKTEDALTHFVYLALTLLPASHGDVADVAVVAGAGGRGRRRRSILTENTDPEEGRQENCGNCEEEAEEDEGKLAGREEFGRRQQELLYDVFQCLRPECLALVALVRRRGRTRPGRRRHGGRRRPLDESTGTTHGPLQGAPQGAPKRSQ